MGVILHLLSEDFYWINDAMDVFRVNILLLITFLNHVLYEIYMFDYLDVTESYHWTQALLSL